MEEEEKKKRRVRIGMIGGGAIARAHVVGYRSVPLLHGLESVEPVFSIVADATEELASQAASKLGFQSHWSDWRRVVSSPEVDLEL